MLEVAKAFAFLGCILSLYQAAIQAFIVPDARWENRLFIVFLYLFFSASVCVFSGLLFSWPSPANPDRGRRLASTLPVRLFLWSAACILVLFVSSWYLSDLSQQAAPFISDRATARF